MAVEVLVGAAIKVAFKLIVVAVKKARKEKELIKDFEPQLKQLEETLQMVKPMLADIEKTSTKLKESDQREVELLKSILEEGSKLVSDCLSESPLKNVKKLRYQKQLVELENKIIRFLITHIQLGTFREVKNVRLELRAGFSELSRQIESIKQDELSSFGCGAVRFDNIAAVASIFWGGVRYKEGNDGLLSFPDVGKYGSGDFSMAVVQARQELEDQSQIESGPLGTFVGVYDGHGGPEASRSVCYHLFRNFQAIAEQSQGAVTADTIHRAFLQTEEGFTSLVSELWNERPRIATTGTSCLVGVIFQQTLFVANVGDSRVVLGKKFGDTGGIAAIQLSTEHNANLDAIRQELKKSHPHDPQIVVLKDGVWKVKGIIQVSRSIGDVYMKHAQFNRKPINRKFRLPEPMNMPILSASPDIISHPLQSSDSFLIFASAGLWEHLNNEEAVNIVQSNPRPKGSAKRLIKAALEKAAKNEDKQYSELREIKKGGRLKFHGDMTVIVLFLNHDLISSGTVTDPPLSIRSALGS
ncbi:hypothetical protein QN277_007421 [Acacia crassicarpa]|uniref:protein-serine/threonine phosphatase n=1 Tax=Acacia crassicarpa TaxID=499986 RepID=A0AAE1IWZ7_9FABA|nr:hypothetical protein QN277_007421 [Acacia crassicarpa]